jgi:hypothetical protein
VNPSIPATKATIKNTNAQPNMIASLAPSRSIPRVTFVLTARSST